MTTPKRIKQAFATAILNVAGVGHALDHDPEQLPSLEDGACVTLVQRRFKPEIVETGPAEQMTWEWTVLVYLELRDYQRTSDALDDLLPGLFAAIRADYTLGQVCDQATLTDDGQEPVPFHDEGVLIKTLRLLAVTDEET